MLSQNVRIQISAVIFGIIHKCSMDVNENDHSGLMELADYGNLNDNKQRPKCNGSSY